MSRITVALIGALLALAALGFSTPAEARKPAPRAIPLVRAAIGDYHDLWVRVARVKVDGYYYVEQRVWIECDRHGNCRQVRVETMWANSWKIVYPTRERRDGRR